MELKIDNPGIRQSVQRKNKVLPKGQMVLFELNEKMKNASMRRNKGS